MADDTSTTTTEETAATAAEVAGDGTQHDETPADEQGLPEGAKKALTAARKQARDAEKARKALQTEVDSFKQRDMTDQQRLEADRDTHKTAASEAQADAARLRAALKYGLTEEDLDLLGTGTTKEIDERAKRLADRLGSATTATSFDGGARTTTARPNDMNDLIRRSVTGGR